MTVEELDKIASALQWKSYLATTGVIEKVSTLNVTEPKFFAAVQKELTSVPMSDWKAYLRWHAVHSRAPYLSKKFVAEDFNFYRKTLRGVKAMPPRWKRCVQYVDRDLGEALGQEFVARTFPPETKAKTVDMTKRIETAMEDEIKNLDWMTPATKERALEKLHAVANKVGYPDRWRDYSTLKVVRGDFYGNTTRATLLESQRDLAKIGKPVDRNEWGMTPPTVNAYYNPQMNEIVFPAGILQPPFFDPDADDASNFGGIGAVIGHEMTHGFDDQGRKFDAQGNLRDWWTPEDQKKFNERAQCVKTQFESYKIQDDLHENGDLVLGESIADLGGLNIAYRALQKELATKRPSSIGGFTPEQRFFLAYTQIWAANDRPEFERLMLNTNPHPLARLRAIAAPSNMPAFSQAFGCKAGDAMVL